MSSSLARPSQLPLAGRHRCPDLVDTATLPTGGMGGGTDTNDFVTGGAFTLSGQELSLQLTGTPGFTTIDFPAITLPTGGGGGGGAAGRTLIGTIASSNAQTAAALTLDEALSETALYRATLTDGDGTVAAADFLGAELLGLSETAAPPTSDNNSLILSLARPGSLTGSAATVVRIWNGDSSTGIYVQKSRTDTQAFRLYKVVYEAAGGGGGGSDENNYLSGVTSSVAGQMVTLNFAREGLANLSTDFMIPGGVGGDDAFDWATVGDASLVPTDKLGTGTANANHVLIGNQTFGRVRASMLTANFLNTGSPDEADYMLFADSGSGRPLSFITYGSFLDGIAGVGIAHGGETLHIDATGATTGQVYSYTGDGTTLNFAWVDLPTGVGTTVAANPSGTPTSQLKTVMIGSTVHQVRSTFAVKYLSDRPVADEDTVGHIYHVLAEAQAYFGVEDSHQSTTPSGTFNNIPSRGDLHIVATLPTNLNNLTTGDFYYHAGGDPARGGFEFYEVVVRGTKQLENVHASRALAASRSNNSYSVAWLGSQADSTEALAFTDAISSTTNYFFHNETTDTIQRLVNSSYSGPTVEPHYQLAGHRRGWGRGMTCIADSLAFAVSGQEVTATLGRSIGADLTATFTVPGGGSGDDAFDWATVGNTDLVPTAKLGPGVANADRILRGSRTWGRINANMLTASFVDDDPPDEADYMLFADSGPGRLLSFRTYGSFLDGIASDIKTVTALPDPEDVDDADKDKLWLVVPTVDTGVEEVAHFKPAGDTTVFTMTAADHTYGSGLHLVGTDKADRLGHLEPKTNLHDIYWEDTLDTYYIEFQDGSTSPFDYSNYTNGLSLYFREQGDYRQLAPRLPRAAIGRQRVQQRGGCRQSLRRRHGLRCDRPGHIDHGGRPFGFQCSVDHSVGAAPWRRQLQEPRRRRRAGPDHHGYAGGPTGRRRGERLHPRLFGRRL